MRSKEESAKTIVESPFVLTNGKVLNLSKVYKKLTGLPMDFDMLDDMLIVIEDSITIETSLKVYQKLETKLKEDAQSEMQALDKNSVEGREKSFEIEQAFIKNVNALAEKEVALEKSLRKVKQSLLKKANVTLEDFKILMEFNLVDLKKE